MNILIPMAGEGNRFKKAGYLKPKPFIDVAGRPMIVQVLENLKIPNARYILAARTEHIAAEKELITQISRNYNAVFVPVDQLTEGTACTVLFAREYINNSDPLMIANSDQIIDINIAKVVSDCINRELDGSILTFVDEHRDPKWSFAKINEEGLVTEVKEKQVISQYATVGIYFYTKGHYFVEAAIDMIVHNDRVNNEFYTCPTYNYMIKENKKIGIYNIRFDQMHGIGTPEDLSVYLNLKGNQLR